MSINIKHAALQRIIREEINRARLDESIGVDTIDQLDAALAKAHDEIYNSHPTITGRRQWDATTGEPYVGDPHEAAVEWLVDYVRKHLAEIKPR
tara:strand:- start:203 stop:484 length:282 start_codon:yes stop_codon:yes gene_type:complete